MKALLCLVLLFAQFILLNAQVPLHDHVVIVMFENKTYDQVIGRPDRAPYINSLVGDTHTALFSESYGLAHPSQPNYLHLFSGAKQGVNDNDRPSSGLLPFTAANLGAGLIASGKTFIGYSEGLPSEGYTGNSPITDGPVAKWVRKHCPWINWQGSSTNGIPSSSNKPFTSFPAAGSYNTLPTLSFIIPDLDNGMHDGAWVAAITVGDTWLQTNLDNYIQWAKANNSLLIITFDEDNDDCCNHIPTLFIGENVLGGSYSDHIDHHYVLRTLEDMFGLPYAGNSANVTPITNIWIDPLPIELLSFKASPESEGVKLGWATATEVNNDFFTVENSSDGNAFSPIATVKGAGTSVEPQRYTHLHKTPFAGKSYYRLKQTDFDKKHTFSEIIAVNRPTDADPSLSVFPNPAQGSSFQIVIRDFNTENLLLSIQNEMGQTVASKTLTLPDKRDTFSFTYDTELQPGIYWLEISGNGIFKGQKIIIH